MHSSTKGSVSADALRKTRTRAVPALQGFLNPPTDQQNHGVKDYWQSQRETLQSGQGACEDYALAKYQALQDLGIPEKELHLFYVKNRNNITHMVLVHTNAEGKSQVLDNESSLVFPTSRRSDLRPVFGFFFHTKFLSNPS